MPTPNYFSRLKSLIGRARSAADAIVVLIVAAIMLAVILATTGDFIAHPIGMSLVYLAIAAWLLGMWFSRYVRLPKPAGDELPPLSGTYGSAHYAPMQTQPGDVTSGVFFGKSHTTDMIADDYGAPVCSKPENHTLIVARTRTGKGTRVIIPTLLRASRTSALVIDPKGEDTVISFRARAVHSHVHVMNPWRVLGDTCDRLGIKAATYNPLDILDKDDPNVVAIAQGMGKALCPSHGVKEPFWANSAANLIAAVLLWITDREGLDRADGGDLPEEKTLSRLSDIVNRSRKSLTHDFVANMAASEAFEGAIRRLSAPFIDMPDVTYGGIMGHVAEATSFLTDPQILAATAKSSFSMTDLTGAGKDRPTTLYLVVPWDKLDVQKTWLRLMITAGMHTFRNKPPDARYRCLFLIDEFPALGFIEKMPTEIAAMAGAGVDLALVVQGMNDLKLIYGEAHQSILGNCAYKWFCNVNDNQSADYLSKTLGQKTVRTTSKSENTGQSKGHGGHSTSEGENISHGETGKPLLSLDEVLNLGSDIAILLAPNTRPHYLKPIDYWRLQEAFEPFRKGYPSLFWPLYYDPNPYRALNDQATCPDPLPSAADVGRYAPTSGGPASGSMDYGLYSPAKKPAAQPKPGSNYDPSTFAPKPGSNYDPSTYAPKKKRD